MSQPIYGQNPYKEPKQSDRYLAATSRHNLFGSAVAEVASQCGAYEGFGIPIMEAFSTFLGAAFARKDTVDSRNLSLFSNILERM